jgi:RNA recognition motif-containing protein
MDGFELRGRYIEVKEPRGRKRNTNDLRSLKMKIKEGVRTIFVNNLPYNISEQEIGDYFRVCGKIENIRMVYNSSKGHFKGYF